jgi:multiple sugar transport system permease protein
MINVENILTLVGIIAVSYLVSLIPAYLGQLYRVEAIRKRASLICILAGLSILLIPLFTENSVNWQGALIASAIAALGLSAYAYSQGERGELSREDTEMFLGAEIKTVLILFFAVVTIFPFYWMLNLSMRPEADILTNPTKLIPTVEDIRTTLHPVGCWLRYGTDDIEENSELPDECVNVFGQSSFTIVLAEQGFPPFILNSAFLAISTVSLTLFLAIPAAYAITRLQFGGRNTLSAGILLIYMFPAIVLAIPLFVVFTQTGLRESWGGLIIVYMSGTLPVALYMLRSYFITIPKDLEEAALIDGCTYFSTIWRVTIPLATPAIASVALYTFMIAWNEFLYAFLFLVGDPDRWTLPLGLQRLNSQEVPISALMAGSLIVSIPIIIIFFFFERFLTRGLTAGAVKG